MAGKKRGLGRGLDALLGGMDPVSSDQQQDSDLRHIPVDLIQPGKYQPRLDIHNESLEDLASSIRAQGIIQPIVVRPIGNGDFEIIAGERRWRAAQLAELHEVPVVVRDVPDQAAIAMALIENIQRENLNPMEESIALQRLIKEFEMTHAQAAEADLIKLTVDIERLKLQANQDSVTIYATKVRAKADEYDLFRTAWEAEETKQKVFAQQLAAHDQQVETVVKSSQLKQDQFNSEIDLIISSF